MPLVGIKCHKIEYNHPRSIKTLYHTMSCEAITAKGSQCLRNAISDSDYCWQHDRMYNREDYSDNCRAITKKGHYCSRRATKGSYCWQHARYSSCSTIHYKESKSKKPETETSETDNLKEQLKMSNQKYKELIKQHSRLIQRYKYQSDTIADLTRRLGKTKN